VDSIDRVAASLYKASGGHVPFPVLKRLGIATPRRRIEFQAIDHLLRTMAEVKGSVIECGAYQGATLLGMAHILRLRGLRPNVYGLDSFEGFPEPAPQDSPDGHEFPPEVRKGWFSDTSFETLQAKVDMLGFGGWVHIIKGFFDQTLPTLSDERFSLAHIDCDLYEPHLTCLEFLYPRMLPGGVIVFDEYASRMYQGAAKAVDEFFRDRPEKLEHWPDIPQQGTAGHEAGVRHFVRIVR
jgi:hypothetical protein